MLRNCDSVLSAAIPSAVRKCLPKGSPRSKFATCTEVYLPACIQTHEFPWQEWTAMAESSHKRSWRWEMGLPTREVLL